MDDTNERMRILEMIESGRISASQGLALLQALSGALPGSLEAPDEGEEQPIDQESGPSSGWTGDSSDPDLTGWSSAEEIGAYTAGVPLTRNPVQPQEPLEPAWEPLNEIPAPLSPASPATFDAPYGGADEPEEIETRSMPPDTHKWSGWWAIPLAVGGFIAAWGGMFMYVTASVAQGISLWFLCASVPFVIGVVIAGLALLSRNAPWLHLRVQQKPGEKPERIAISFPIPIRPVAWFFRTFGDRIPKLKNNTNGINLDEVIMAIGQSTSRDNPIYIQVDEDDGEKVEIFIG
jgi:hypothetical protein